MSWLNRLGRTLVLLLLLLGAVCGCAVDTDESKTIKIDDPFASESEEQFHGLVISYWKLPDGESSFVRLPNGKTMLIDTGSERDVPTILDDLSRRKVTKLDYAVITNDLPNHVGGYAKLAQTLQIDTLLLPKLIGYSIRHSIPIAADKRVILLSERDTLPLDSGISLFVLHPSENLLLAPQDNSLVFQIKHDKLHFLFTSGIGEAAEERLLERYKEHLRAEVLKVAEQGSSQSSSQPFLTAVDPQVAVIQTGKSLYDMKANEEEIVERLHESWTETFITSQQGSITVLSNGKNYRVIKEKSGKGRR